MMDSQQRPTNQQVKRDGRNNDLTLQRRSNPVISTVLVDAVHLRNQHDNLHPCVGVVSRMLWRRALGMRRFASSGGEVKGHPRDGLREGFPAIDLARG